MKPVTGRRMRHRNIRARSRFYYERDKVKHLARARVHSAVKAGKMPRVSTLTCTDCPSPACDYDHWRGYEGDAALDVQPVCRPCHMARGSGRSEHPNRSPRGRRELIRDWAVKQQWLAGKAERGHGAGWGVPDWGSLWVAEAFCRPCPEYDYELEQMAHVAVADAVSDWSESVWPRGESAHSLAIAEGMSKGSKSRIAAAARRRYARREDETADPAT